MISVTEAKKIIQESIIASKSVELSLQKVAGMVLAELCKSRLQIRTRAGIEVGPSRIEQPALEQEDGVVVNRV